MKSATIQLAGCKRRRVAAVRVFVLCANPGRHELRGGIALAGCRHWKLRMASGKSDSAESRNAPAEYRFSSNLCGVKAPPCAARRLSAHAIPPVRYPEAFGEGDAEEPCVKALG